MSEKEQLSEQGNSPRSLSYGAHNLRRPPFGRGQALVERLADDLQRSFGGPPLAKARRERLNRHRVGRLRRDCGLGSFEVSLVDEDGDPTGFVALVTVSYSRFDADEANRTRS